jgi:hypothetical protein
MELHAAHFGVTLDQYVSSAPSVGMTGFVIGQEGLAFVGRYRSDLVRPQALFAAAYKDVQPAADALAVERSEYLINDEVVDFAADHNVSPLAVVRIGAAVLNFAAVSNCGPRNPMEIREVKRSGLAGKLDSRLYFGISAMNTVVVQRKKTGLLRR